MASLVGRHVELRFDPEDLTRIDVYCDGVSAGAAVPLVIGRHTHPAVPQAPQPPAPPPEAPGVDYLGLVAAAHEEATYGSIAYRDVALSPAEGGEQAIPSGAETQDNDEEVH